LLNDTFEEILGRYLGKDKEEDLEKVEKSTSIPHYQEILSLNKANYIYLRLPLHITSIITQIRLNYLTLYINFKYHRLGAFKSDSCLRCNLNEIEDLNHIFTRCTLYKDIRNTYMSNIHFTWHDCDYFIRLSTEHNETYYTTIYEYLSKCIAKRG